MKWFNSTKGFGFIQPTSQATTYRRSARSG
ncbi:cold shock domain-containing protein (plasmid) [Mesorhizobium sp. AR07]|nr:cold shock domain-containing protein [Mesorhizobium sp. AR07]